MESTGTQYDIALQVCEPKFETERRYVAAELEYVRRQAAGARRWMSWPSLGVYNKKDWSQYERQLVNYAHALDQHEQEIEEGWLPFKIHIMNVGPRDDSQVAMKLLVENGAISVHKKAPDRPPRMDGGGSRQGSKLRLPKFKGFMRYGIKLRRREMQATFSELEAGDSADMVRQTLYLHYSPHTRLHFQLNSRLVKDFTAELAA